MSPLKRLAGPVAALAWFLFCVRWFDAAQPFRPGVLAAVPAAAAAGAAAAAVAFWLLARGGGRPGPAPGRAEVLLVALLATGFRLPLVWWGAWGYTTADGSLSGVMALQIRDGAAHHVFVPSVAYSGSLKSHLAALLSAAGLDAVRAFALASVLFHALFAAAACRLGRLAGGPRAGLAAGLYAAFAPTFVTWYSLSNDGNYVEVLALGTLALLLAALQLEDERPRAAPAYAIGVLLGLGFWCHILAVVHGSAIALCALARWRWRSAAVLARIGAGAALGDLPGLLWNAANGWDSFRYLVPSAHWELARALEAAPGEARPGALERLRLLLFDHGPLLFGYDAGYPPRFDALSRGLAWLGLLAFAAALALAVRRALAARRIEVHGLLVVFAVANTAVALLALPHVPGNPRYLLFLFAPACVLMAARLGGFRAGRLLLAVLVGFGALGSLGQARAKLRDSFAWREFVLALRAEGVRACYTDYYIASRINFFAEGDPLCSSKLGPVTTEYFLENRERVDRAPAVDIVAINAVSAARMQRRLGELGVAHERRDLMKPVLLRLSRKVDPRELFPGRDFRPR